MLSIHIYVVALSVTVGVSTLFRYTLRNSGQQINRNELEELFQSCLFVSIVYIK